MRRSTHSCLPCQKVFPQCELFHASMTTIKSGEPLTPPPFASTHAACERPFSPHIADCTQRLTLLIKAESFQQTSSVWVFNSTAWFTRKKAVDTEVQSTCRLLPVKKALSNIRMTLFVDDRCADPKTTNADRFEQE